MVNGYNFESLVKSINTELNAIKNDTSPISLKNTINDIYDKLDGLKGYEFDRQLTQQSFSFYQDSNSNGIWQFNLPDMQPNSYTYLQVNGTPYMFQGVLTSTTDIVPTINTYEEAYPNVFVANGTTLYLTVPNTGVTQTLYQNWIDDQATLTGITEYFTNNKYNTSYYTIPSSTLTIEITNVVTSVLTANTFHANTTNDLAEYRIQVEDVEPGYVVEEQGEYINICRKDRCKSVVGIVSDTSQLTMGNKEFSLPVAISGRVLAYYEGKLKTGDLVCSTKNGKVRKMKWWEKILFPEAILGKVLFIPTYTKWNNVEVNGRVWILVK